MLNIKKTKGKNRIISGLLAICMLVGIIPLNVFAEDAEYTNSEVVTSFAKLQISQQEVSIGSADLPTFPTELEATLTKITWEQVPSEQPQTEESAENTGEVPLSTWQSSTTTEDINVPVRWVLADGETFSTNEENIFTYTAKIEDDAYTVSSDVVMPTFTVNVVKVQQEQPLTPPIVESVTASTPSLSSISPLSTPVPVGDFLVSGGTSGLDYIYANGVLTIQSDEELTISNANPAVATRDIILIGSGFSANIILLNVNIDVSFISDGSSSATDEDRKTAFEIPVNSSASITLQGNNILKSGYYKPGIAVMKNASCTISGNGSLEVVGGSRSAGIGGSFGYSNKDLGCGDITINSGTITATGGESSAGIGMGGWNDSGSITINGGNITATGGSFAAGIGTGSVPYIEMNITITGGTINAHGGLAGAGIGSGRGDFTGISKIANIVITGGIITAVGNGEASYGHGAGIGAGENCGSKVQISGGTINATGSGDSAGIGAAPFAGGSLLPSVFIADGDAAIFTNSITDNSYMSEPTTSGLIIVGNTGTFYGTQDVTIGGNAVIESDTEINIPSDRTLIISNGSSLTNNGTIFNNGTINNQGSFINNGSLQGSGALTGNDISRPLVVTGGTAGLDYDYLTNNILIKTPANLTISNLVPTQPSQDYIKIADGVTANITFDNLNIDASKSLMAALELGVNSAANITLTENSTNSLTSGAGNAGILAQSGDVTIEGNGSLNIVGGADGITAENVTVKGSHLNVKSGVDNEGINGKLTATDNAFVSTSSLTDDSTAGSWNAIVIVDEAGKVYGDYTLNRNATINTGITLTVDRYASLTINSGVSLTNSGTFILDGGEFFGNIAGNGTYISTVFSDEDIEDIGIVYYTGSALSPEVTFKTKLINGAEFVVDATEWSRLYTNNTLVGSGTVTFSRDGFSNVDKSFTIMQSATGFESVEVKNNGAVTNDFTYGDTITITAKQKATGVAARLSSLTQPQTMQMALYLKADGTETQISEAVSADTSGVYTLSYDTAGRDLDIGANTLVLKFVGDTNQAGHSEEIIINLSALSISLATVNLGSQLIYNGSPQTQSIESVVMNEVTLIKDIDYTVDNTTQTVGGTYSLTVKGAGYYVGEASKDFTIQYSITIAAGEAEIVKDYQEYPPTDELYSLPDTDIHIFPVLPTYHTVETLTVTGPTGDIIDTKLSYHNERAYYTIDMPADNISISITYTLDGYYGGSVYLGTSGINTFSWSNITADMEEYQKLNTLQSQSIVEGSLIFIGSDYWLVLDEEKGSSGNENEMFLLSFHLKEAPYTLTDIDENSHVLFAETTKAEDSITIDSNNYVNTAISNQHFFDLSISELANLPNNAFEKDAFVATKNDDLRLFLGYRLRSVLTEGIHSSGAFINEFGRISLTSSTNYRQATNIKKDQIVYSYKLPNEEMVVGVLQETSTKHSGWLLALRDEDTTLSITEEPKVLDDTLTFEYSDATTGSNQYLSIMITETLNGMEHVRYYGPVKDLSLATDASGSVSVKLPTDKDGKNIFLLGSTISVKIFNENKDFKQFETYGSSSLCGTLNSFSVKVEGANTLTSVTQPNLTYGETPNPTVDYDGAQNSSDPTYLYKAKGGSDDSYTSTKPTAVGEYTVKATSAANDTIQAKSVTGDFSIGQKSISISSISVADKYYDTNNTAIVNEVVFSGLQYGETFELDVDYSVSASFNDESIAENKSVTATVTLSETPKTKNYMLTSVVASGSADIIKNPLPDAPTFNAMNDSANTFSFNSIDGTIYEYKLGSSASWIEVTANSAVTQINVGNIGLAIGELQVRIKATATVDASEALTNPQIFTASLTGSVAVSGNAIYGERLTAEVTGAQAGARFTYSWYNSDGTQLKSSSENYYDIAGADIGKAIYAEVTAELYTGKLSSNLTVTVVKRPVTAQVVGPITKAYDGERDVDVSLSIAKAYPDDDITVTAPDANFNTAGVGSNKSITLGSLSIAGSASDYYIITPPAGVVGSITTVSLAGATVELATSNFTYNGTSQTPNITVSINGKTVSSSEYEVSYSNTNGGAGNNKNAGTVTVTVSAKADSNYYSVATQKPTYEIKKAMPSLNFSTTSDSSDYDATVIDTTDFTPPTVLLQNGEVYSGVINYSYRRSGVQDYTNGLPTEVGSYEINAQIAQQSNYFAAQSDNLLNFTINKATPTVTINTMDSKQYDGIAISNPIASNVTVTVMNYSDIMFTYYTDNSGAKGQKLNSKPINAGTYWVEPSILETYNTVAVEGGAVKFSITKVDYPSNQKSATAKGTFGESSSTDISFWSNLHGVNFAAVNSWTVTDTDNVLEPNSYRIEDDKIVFSIVDDSSKVGDDKATIKIPITCTNYNNFEVTISISVSGKSVPTVIATPISRDYNGNAVTNLDIVGTATYFDGITTVNVDGQWAFVAGQGLTDVAHSGLKSVIFTPTDLLKYESVTSMVQMTINKATLEALPTYNDITTPGKTLADANLQKGGIGIDGNIRWALANTTPVVANTLYTWEFIPNDIANYNTITGEVLFFSDYVITNGLSQSVTAGKEITFSSNSPYDDYIQTLVDNSPVDPKYVTVTRGSTIVTLSSEFTRILSAGRHTISIVSATGTATGEFFITATPSTGTDSSFDPAISPLTGVYTNATEENIK